MIEEKETVACALMRITVNDIRANFTFPAVYLNKIV